MNLLTVLLAGWSWITATPTRAMVALGVVTFAMNVAIRFFTSPAWAEWCVKHPRVAGVALVLKGAFPEGGTMLRGLLAAITGELRERAKVPVSSSSGPQGPGEPS